MKEFWKQLKENILYASVGGGLFVGFIVFTDFDYAVRMRALYSDQIKSRSIVGEWQCVGTTEDLGTLKSKVRIHSHGTWHSTDVMSEVLEEEGFLFPMEVRLKANGTYKRVDDKYIQTLKEITVTSVTIEGVDALIARAVQSNIEVGFRNAIGMTSVSPIISLDRHEWIFDEDGVGVTRCTRS